MDVLDFDYDRIDDDTFPIWDLDGNGFVDATEWHIGFDESGVFENWDSDDDSFIDLDEWREGMAEAEWRREDVGFWEDWDRYRDGKLSRNEFGDGVFGVWDYDENLRVDAGEFESGRNTL
jgi:hypothetical protein